MVKYSLFIILFIKIFFKPTNSLKKNLIMGTIVKYNWEAVAPFIISFKLAEFENCDCVMFVDQITQNTTDIIKSYDVIVYPVYYENGSPKTVINNYRWKIYGDFLNNNKNKYNLILTIDVRDIIFQYDIFKLYKNYKPFLGLAMEDDNITEIFNSNWMIKAFGFEIYESIKNKRIFCSGSILGTSNIIYEFSRKLWEIIESKLSQNIEIKDQAAANYLIYYKKYLNDSIIKSKEFFPKDYKNN